MSQGLRRDVCTVWRLEPPLSQAALKVANGNLRELPIPTGEALAVVSRWMKRKHVLEREPRVTEVSVGPALLILASLCVAMPPARSEVAISARARPPSMAVSRNG